MEIDESQFRKMFPHLAREMEGKEGGTSVRSILSDIEDGENAASKQFEGYDPDAIDFIRRCDNEQQAEEIITYLEQKKEISHEYASKLKKQLEEKGVRSFGTKKEADYYIRQAGL